MDVTIYHNPRCSKSRQTLAIVRDNGIEPRIVEYLKTPPSVSELRAIIARLGIPARQLLRSGESVYKDLGLDDESLDDDALINAMVANPILIERPIVVAGERAVIGRPPENVTAIL